jgi:hypothetical protein
MSKPYNNAISHKLINTICYGRLTLESGVPISTTNQTAKTTLYFTPYNGNSVSLYDGSEWDLFSFSELSLSLSGYTANTNYDIFIYNNSGTLTLESTAWTNNTTRATALVLQDGVHVKSGATTRRYLGTIRITGTSGQCEDSANRRFLWNYYNQVEKVSTLNYYPGASHTYTTSTWRSWNNNTTVGQTRLEVIRGLNQSPFETKVWCEMINGWSSIAVDSTNIANSYFKANSGGTGAADSFNKFLNINEGYHYLQTIQYGTTGSTFYSLYVQSSFLG